MEFISNIDKNEYIIASNFNSDYYEIPLKRKDKITKLAILS